MELEEKLKELNMTEEEISRFSTAFKDDKFREMLCEYAEEISNPDNRKRYEEEIRLLEQERGHKVEFIHPEPFRCLKTSVNGQERCYINICSNEKVGKPSCKRGVSETGQRGHCWSLPHCLHPGRQDIDQKGKKITIYDVIFHPDTIHMASKSKKFMEIVDGAAIQGIQDSFKVSLDKNNVKHLKGKYKGTPQAPVIRKPIPGYQAKEAEEEQHDPLSVPYPDEKRPTGCRTTTEGSSATKPQSFQIQPEKTNKPTEPKYTVKYRSFFDLQDFRCSRDSGRSPRPKEIVVTIDLPLLKSVGDTGLEITEKNLLLESKNPAYRLELALAYPVDEDKGEAKFNKHSRQLIVTLPVLPSKEVFDFPGAPPAETVTEIQREDEDGQEEEEGRCEKQMGEDEENVEGGQEEMRQQKVEGEEGEEKGPGERRDEGEEEDEKRGGGKCEEEKKEVGDGWRELKVEEEVEGKGQESVEGQKEEGEQVEIQHQKMEVEEGEEEGQREGEEGTVEEERRDDKKCDQEKEVEDRWKELKLEEGRNVSEEDMEEKEEMKQQEMEVEEGEEGKDKGGEETEQNEEEVEEKLEEKEGEEKREGKEYEEEKKEVGGEWKEPKKEEEEEREERGKGQECVEEEEEKEEGRSEQQVPDCLKNAREEEEEDVESTTETKTSDVQGETEKTDTEKMRTNASFLHQIPRANLPSSHQTHTGGSGRAGLSPEEAVVDEDGSAQREDIDEDDLTTEQVFYNPIHEDEPPPVLLREIGEDGSEKIISDHSTSAGFTFQNSLLFELD